MLKNIWETSKVELFGTATAHLLSQPSARERMHHKLLFLSWIKSTYIACGHKQESFYIMGFEIHSNF